jgi:VWFA-related protein
MNLLLSLALVVLPPGPVPTDASARQSASPAQGAARTVYVSVSDAEGVPVSDLAPEDFVVKEGGKDCEVTRARIEDTPLQVAIIVDDNGTGIFRYGLARFVERLDGRAEFSLSTVTGQMFKLVDYTTSVTAVQRGIASLAARPATDDGGQLLAGIHETAKELRKREAQRPVIVVLTVGGEEHSTLRASYVLDALRDSRASLNVLTVARSMLRSSINVTRPSALLEESLNLGEVLGDGPKQSGGRRDEIVATAGMLAGLQHLAEELSTQYTVEYALPPGVRPSERLNVTVRRPNLTVRAPTKIPRR